MTIDEILEKALEREPLTREEAYKLYDEAPLQLLCGVLKIGCFPLIFLHMSIPLCSNLKIPLTLISEA